MRLPYVIENRFHRLADVLNDVLHGDAVHAVDVATAYFNGGGFDLVREGLEALEQDGGPPSPRPREYGVFTTIRDSVVPVLIETRKRAARRRWRCPWTRIGTWQSVTSTR